MRCRIIYLRQLVIILLLLTLSLIDIILTLHISTFSKPAEESETEDQSQPLDQLPFPFPFANLQFLPQGFTFQMTGQGQRETDVKSKLWDLTHLLVMFGIGLYTVMEEFSVEKGAWSRFASLKRSGESIGYWVSLYTDKNWVRLDLGQL